MNRYRVLIADDDVYVCEEIANALKKDGFEIDVAESGERAFSLFQHRQHHIVISDMRMPNEDDGLVLLEKIKQLSAETAVMIITGYSEVSSAVRAMKSGAVDFIMKPLDTEQLVVKIARIAERVDLQSDNFRLRRELSSQYEIIGNSQITKELKRHISVIANRSDNSGVLITGPNGSGKELVARAIKNQSSRAGKPFEIVNCAALPETLIESELFGTMRGAYTNAVDKKGKFELADEGTIFLDEVGDMSLATQAKVLRVLQNGEFTRLGGEKPIRVDVRVISATNKDLEEMIRQKQFREDLYYRLNVIPVKTTPLWKRAEDIPLLIEHQLKKLGTTIEIEELFDREALDYLTSLEWPGNVRELNNVVERLMIFRDGKPITLDQAKLYTSNPEAGNNRLITDTSKTLKEATNDFEREYIGKIVDECCGVVAVAAKRLGLERQYLYEMMRRLGISRNERIPCHSA
ncbi:MAG: sigma-54-dependent Fis family transcriptional regulator [Chitinivibrionales bacterium]|nr:sigma-54-dependent Fis family transcriptional regulator [Chitinivibrionales bacterium]